MHASDLDSLSRSDLISRAEMLGVDKASVLTRAELADEIVRRTVVDANERRVARGLLGVARDLVARVVERGLHLSDAAELLRSLRSQPAWNPAPPPIATVTLAEIYATQGHKARALAVLDTVLQNEPDHAIARQLRDKVAIEHVAAPVLPPEIDDALSGDDAAVSLGASPGAPQHMSIEVAPSSAESPLPKAESPPPKAETPLPPPLPSGPVGMLDDAPLPERYDTNEVVLMPVDPRTVFAYWEVRKAAYEELRGGREGTLVLRLLAVSASWTGPSLETRDVAIEQLVGDCFIRDLPVGAVLRGAIGFRGVHQFEPLSVAMDVTTPVDSVALVRGGEIAEFTPEGARTVHAFSSSSEHESVRQAVVRARGRATTGGDSVLVPGSSWGALSPAPLPPASWGAGSSS